MVKAFIVFYGLYISLYLNLPMPYYQHYSFDLWLTLLKSDPAFKPERAKYFQENYNQFDKPVGEIAQIFRQVDLMCNAVNERSGKNIDSDEMYLMVLNFIHDGKLDLHHVDLTQILVDMEELLFRHPPMLYSPVTLGALKHLKENSGGTFSLLSNTGYITGKTLRKVLALSGLDGFFDFHLYSDEVDMSKPNPAFFELMLTNVDICNPGITIPRSSVIHIGDNGRNDVEPCEALGIRSMLVNSNQQTILNLIN